MGSCSHKVGFNDVGKKNWERIAALLGLDSWLDAIGAGETIALECAEQYVKGKTHVLCVRPEFASLYENNKEFFNALCEEGVVEWLTPLVLTKSANSRLKHHEK
jgi:hypothetical protein